MGIDDGRWDRLFADLSVGWDAEQAAEQRAEVTDRTRREVATLRLVDRLRPATGEQILLRLRGPGPVRGRLLDVGADWALLVEETGGHVLVPLAAVLAIGGLGMFSAMPGSEGKVAARLDLRYALRDLVRDRAAVTATLVDAHVLAGTLDRVGADFVEMAEHATGDARRARAVRSVQTIPLTAVAVIRSR